MSKPLVPDALWSAIEQLLPPDPPKTKGGASEGGGSCGPDGHCLCAALRDSLGNAPSRDWLLGHDLLATTARLACRWCLAYAPPCSVGAVERCKSAGLEPDLTRQRLNCRQKGGVGTGPNPLVRRKPGPKRHVVV